MSAPAICIESALERGRFLAEDLGTRLDAVLDEVLRALAGRTGARATGGGS